MWDRRTVVDGEALERMARAYHDVVYAAALRQCGGDAARAGDVVQAVMVVMVVKGRAGKLPEEAFMAGWLLRVTGYAVKQQARAEARRRKHEGAVGVRGGEVSAVEEGEVRRELDAALLSLGTVDREVVVRRYLQGQSVAEVAAGVGMAENTAGRRIARALEKLRKVLRRRGVSVPVGVVIGVMAGEAAVKAAAVAMTGATPLASATLRAMARAKLMAGTAAMAGAVVVLSAGAVVWNATVPAAAREVAVVAETAPAPEPVAAVPHEVKMAVMRVEEEHSAALLKTLLEGLRVAQGAFRNVHTHARTLGWQTERSTGEWVQTAKDEGEGWIDAARHYRVEVASEEERHWEDLKKPGTLGPLHLSSFTQTWDGTETRKLHGPPLSTRGGSTFDREDKASVWTLLGCDYSMQLCWSEESRADASGSHTVMERYPLAPEVLALMKLSARRVTLAGGVEAMELHVEMPNDGVASPKDELGRSEIFWFDPARGYGMLGREETQSMKGEVVMQRRWVIDSLRDAGQGVFVPGHGVMCWLIRGNLFLFDEYTGMAATANEPLGAGIFSVEFPKGVRVTDFKNGMGTERGK